MKGLFLALLLVVGCGPVDPPPTEHDGPFTVVWDQTYQASMCVRPKLVMHYGDTCDGHENVLEYEGKCYYGYYFPSRHEAHVEWRGTYHDSSFAHELLHAWQNCRGWTDYEHEGEEWTTLLPVANQNLILAGY